MKLNKPIPNLSHLDQLQTFLDGRIKIDFIKCAHIGCGKLKCVKTNISKTNLFVDFLYWEDKLIKSMHFAKYYIFKYFEKTK